MCLQAVYQALNNEGVTGRRGFAQSHAEFRLQFLEPGLQLFVASGPEDFREKAAARAFEYSEKFKDHLYPGINFNNDPAVLHHPNMNHAQLFYGLYFGMTGLHAVHIIVGIGVLIALIRLFVIEAKCVMKDYVPTKI